MDSDLSKSVDKPRPVQRKSFSLAKSFLQADLQDEDDDIDPKEISEFYIEILIYLFFNSFFNFSIYFSIFLQYRKIRNNRRCF